ncbi:MAG: LysE family translocator [Roseinatronobacter sp.]
MDPLAYSALFLAALLNAALPGPVMFLIVANAAERGLRSGTVTALGALMAFLLKLGIIWPVLQGAMELGHRFLSAVQIAGVGVLVILGLYMLTRPAGSAPARIQRTGMGDMASGAVLVLLNPVNLVFYLALLPQFVVAGQVSGRQMGTIIALVMLASSIPIAIAVLLGLWQARFAPKSTVWAIRAGGVAMLGFAGLVASGAA